MNNHSAGYAVVRVNRLGMAVFTIAMLMAGPSSKAQTRNRLPANDSLEKLVADFWTWRVVYAPFTGDDVPRLEHPRGLRDWSAASITKRREELSEFESRWKNLDRADWPVPKQVDYELLGSA
jgi:hypothetical protein